ncbi:MAG: WD40/YVTN/BNR-like repeat-containing protein [Neptuniibacter sp.]
MTDAIEVDGRLLVSGERGRIFYSDDQGASWHQSSVPVSVMITAMSNAGEKKIWAVGHDGVVITSSDKGETWSKSLDGAQLNQLKVDYYKRLLKEVVSEQLSAEELDELYFRAEDAEFAAEENRFNTLLDIYFVDSKEGYILGSYGLIFQTLDGGTSWQPIIEKLGNIDGFHLSAITKVNNQLVIAGEGGVIFSSFDNGLSWKSLSSPYDGSFFGIQATSGESFVVYGLRGSAFETRDGGVSWSRLVLPINRTLSGSSYLRDGSLVLVGSFGSLLVRTQGNQIFKKIPLSKSVPAVSVVALENRKLLVASVVGPQIVNLDKVSD